MSFGWSISSSSSSPFSAKSRGNFVHTVQWDTLPRPLQISECRQPCDLFSVHSSRLLAAPQQAQSPFPELLACRLSPGCGISVSVYSLCPTTDSSTSPLSLAPTISPVPLPGVVPPSPSPYITANNECIRNPTFLCPSVARFFVS